MESLAREAADACVRLVMSGSINTELMLNKLIAKYEKRPLKKETNEKKKTIIKFILDKFIA